MNKALFGLLNCAAVTSSAITDIGKKHLSEHMMGDNTSWWGWTAMSCGNDTSISAAASNYQLYGNETYCINETGVYEADFKAKYEHTFNYSNLASHKFGEVAIVKNVTEGNASTILARIVYDDITLNLSDTMKISMTITF